jgi:hypothetical protein
MPRVCRRNLGNQAFAEFPVGFLRSLLLLRRQPYAQQARGCAECHYQASVRNDSLAEGVYYRLT